MFSDQELLINSHVFQEGFAYLFDHCACQKCDGNCCRMESGYVWLKKADILRIANYTGIDADVLVQDYLIKIGRRFSLKEIRQGDEYPCIFFDMSSKRCLIYPVRPSQCRTFPFWEEFMGDDGKASLPQGCPGIVKRNDCIKVEK